MMTKTEFLRGLENYIVGESQRLIDELTSTQFKTMEDYLVRYAERDGILKMRDLLLQELRRGGDIYCIVMSGQV